MQRDTVAGAVFDRAGWMAKSMCSSRVLRIDAQAQLGNTQGENREGRLWRRKAISMMDILYGIRHYCTNFINACLLIH